MNTCASKMNILCKWSLWSNYNTYFVCRFATNTYSQNIGATSANSNQDILRNRLIYQSRKRGTLENCIIFSTFADKYLCDFDDSQLKKYDALINSAFDEWELYAWAIGSKPIPQEFDNDIMHLLKNHVTRQNKR